jgi:hypothetical protein
MNKFYHGTTERNARAIESEGFLGSDPSEFTDGFSHVEDGVIFLATTPEHAAGYGEIVFVIETTEAVYFGDCPVTGLPEYAVNVNGQYDYERI